MSLKIKLICLKSSLVALFLLFLQLAWGQTSFTGVDDFLQKNQKQLGKDAAVLVYKDGKIVYQKAMGEFFNAKTQAEVAGCSELFTAAVVLTFVDEGKISLDDPVVKYIPLFRSYMKNYVTIRQCLTHTTGIENDKGGLTKLFQKKKFATLEDEVKAIAAKEISDNPGKEFHYGSIGPTLAARCIEVVSKKSFDRLITERIFRKLKMRSSTFTNYDGNAPDPAGGAQSSGNDMINFMTMLLNKGTFEGKPVLSEASVQELLKAQPGDLPIKFIPDEVRGFQHSVGAWVQPADNGSKTTGIFNPSFTGTCAYIDPCRNYAAVLFVKTPVKEQKKDFILQFKEVVDSAMGECK